MTSQPGSQTTSIHKLTNIWRKKDNQTMKSGQLIKYNMRSIFPEESYTKSAGDTIPGPFSKKSN